MKMITSWVQQGLAKSIFPFLAIGFAFGSFSATALEPTKKATLTVGNATISTPPYAAYNTSVPLAIFFAEEGLEVKMIGMGGATVATQALGADQVDIAVPASSAPLALLEKMPDAGIVGFYTFINGFQSMPVTLQNSPIKDLSQLNEKTIGVQALGNSQVQTTKALVKIAGGDPTSIRFVAVGEGVEAAHALQSKRVDALVLFDGLYGQIEMAGVPLHRLSSKATSTEDVGFSGVIITKTSFMKEHRDVLIRYGRAIAKATVFTKANPEAAVRIHWKLYPETRVRGMSEQDAMKTALASLNARLENVFEVEGMIGNSTLRQVEGYIALNQAGGQLTKGNTLASLWDSSLMQEINNFDKEAVRKRALNWRPD